MKFKMFLKATTEEQLTRLYGREFDTGTILTEKNCSLIVVLKFGV